MGPILQYMIGVPAGLAMIVFGLYGAFKAFTNTAEEEKHNGFGAGIGYLSFVAFGAAILWAILWEGLWHWGQYPRYC